MLRQRLLNEVEALLNARRTENPAARFWLTHFVRSHAQSGRGKVMWSRRRLLVLGTGALAGCAGGGSGSGVHTQYYWGDPFDGDNWLYYYEDDEFLAGLDEEQKEELRQEWDQLSPEDKQQIRDQWNRLSEDDRARVRAEWDALDVNQREQVIGSMQNRARSGTLNPVVPMQAPPSRVQARPDPSFAPSRSGGRGGSYGRGGLGGRGGGRGGRR
jgi:DNA-binding transcriptional MerR regulator